MILIACIWWVLAISILKNVGTFWNDSINEILAQFGLATSIIIISQLVWYEGDIENYLFWDIFAVSQMDMYYAMTIAVFVLIVYTIYKNKILQVSFNQELAKSKWVNIWLVNLIFVTLLALSIAVSIKIIWVLLISAFLIIPPNIAKMLAINFNQMITYSIIFGLIWVFFWVILSYMFKIPSGAMIILVLLILFVFTLILTSLKKCKQY